MVVDILCAKLPDWGNGASFPAIKRLLCHCSLGLKPGSSAKTILELNSGYEREKYVITFAADVGAQ